MENLKRYWWLVSCAWALLAFISWNYESTCGVFFSSGCLSLYWDGLRWITLLKWVSPYQTLIAGIFAVAGGAFALIAARHSTETAIRLERAKSRQSAIVACSIVADEFRDASKVLSKVVGADMLFHTPPPSPFVQTPGYTGTLHSIDPLLGSIVSAHKREIEETIESVGNRGRYHHINEKTAKCYAVWHLLILLSDRLDETGRYDLKKTERLPAGPLVDHLRTSNVRPESLIGLYSFFDWSKA